MLIKKIGLILATATFSMTPLLGLVHGDESSSSSADSGAMGMRVSAVLPENQVNKDHTYFDLLVKPNDEQTLRRCRYRPNIPVPEAQSPQTWREVNRSAPLPREAAQGLCTLPISTAWEAPPALP